jgi:hypothetical protein
LYLLTVTTKTLTSPNFNLPSPSKLIPKKRRKPNKLQLRNWIWRESLLKKRNLSVFTSANVSWLRMITRDVLENIMIEWLLREKEMKS